MSLGQYFLAQRWLAACELFLGLCGQTSGFQADSSSGIFCERELAKFGPSNPGISKFEVV